MLNTPDTPLNNIKKNYLGSTFTKDSVKPLKLKTCKVCKTKFQPTKPFQKVCGVECAIKVALKARDKILKSGMLKQKRDDKVKREKLKSRSDWLKEAQTAFNAFIRERDRDQPCISCGRNHQGQYHGGHFYSTAARPEIRFHEDNVHKQCSVCNNHLSGNIALYREALIAKIGLERFEALSGYHSTKHYSIDDLKAIKSLYSAKLKDLKQ